VSKMDWVDPAVWYTQLPTVHVAAMALIRDTTGRILVVKPNYRPHWTLPGGMADEGESPDATVAREVREELDFSFEPSHLAVIDWASPQGKRKRPLIAFIFNAGVIESPDIKLQKSELDEWKFVALDEMGPLMSSAGVSRIKSAIRAISEDCTVLLVDGIEMRASSSQDFKTPPINGSLS